MHSIKKILIGFWRTPEGKITWGGFSIERAVCDCTIISLGPVVIALIRNEDCYE